MKQSILILLFQISGLWSFAQNDSLPVPGAATPFEEIAASRRELIAAFLAEDRAGVGLWMNTLNDLEDARYAALIWDERWLLYYWAGSYGTLLEEVSQFDETQRTLQALKVQPAADSLFQWVDWTLNENRFEHFSSIQDAFLNTEEKAFSSLLLEYLLRLNKDEEEWAERLEAFETHYPSSRFLNFVRSIKPHILKPTKHALGFAGGLVVGNWNGKIERSLETPNAFGMEAYYWTQRWNLLFDCAFSGPTIRRDLLIDGEIWPKNDPTSFFTLGLNLGYDIIHAPKIRVFPSVGAGVGFLKPPTPEEDEDPLPDYYANFVFHEFHLQAALTTDIKLFVKNYRDWNAPKGSYHGIRLKFGWNGLNFGHQNKDLQGDMFYFAAYYNIFAFLAKQ